MVSRMRFSRRLVPNTFRVFPAPEPVRCTRAPPALVSSTRTRSLFPAVVRVTSPVQGSAVTVLDPMATKPLASPMR